jgi:thymidylate synthase
MSYTPDDENLIDVNYDHINVQVFQLLEDLEAAGQTSSPRGLKTREANMATLDLNPYYTILDYEPRKFNWKYFAGELAWYLKADRNIDFISNFSSFWKDICPTGSANSNYGALLFKPHPSTIDSDLVRGDHPVKNVNQLEWVYNSLVKDSHTRQAVAFFNAPYFQYAHNKDFVCTMYVNFWIRKDYLDMKVQMRSNDIFFGLTYDAPWFSLLHQSLYLNLKKIYPSLKLGVYYHCADNIHFYERHFELAERILDSTLNDSIKLELREPLFHFENGKVQLTAASKEYIENIEKSITEGNKDSQHWKDQISFLCNVS